ncbi:heme ABC transporter ATP-binding protein [Gordonia sp. DT30]|uniref:heme ABC transporter ATP-binding protein n=1 Tax=Gordonia sp. DT30 TaxID=3416546 RepID=UPI003CF46110
MTEPDSGTRTGIHAHDVVVNLGGRDVVDHVSLDVAPGELVALVGPNGCGKSTLLSALSGARAPQSGAVVVDGRDVARISHRELARRRSVVTQHNRVDTPFTVGEVVEMGRYPWLRSPQAARSPALIADAIARCDLDAVVHQPFSQLSGGQQARVSLARALAQHTPVMMLDEPTAALDIRHQEQVLQILCELRDSGSAILLVVHDLSLAAAYADRVALMTDGRLLAFGPTREVLTSELLSQTYDHPVDIFERDGRLIVMPVRK